MALIGALAIVATLTLVYKQNMISFTNFQFLRKIYEVAIPFYTYVLITRIPFVFVETYNNLQLTLFFCIPAIIIALIQFILPEKEKILALAFSKVSIGLLIITGLFSINKFEVTILILLILPIKYFFAFRLLNFIMK